MDYKLEWNRLRGRKIVHFLHIGKTGGNAIRSALQLEKGRFRLVQPDCLIGMRTHHTRLSDIPEGEKVIFTLRDPLTRFVSGFNGRQRKGGSKNNPWSADEERAFSCFATANDLALALSASDPQQRLAAQEAMGAIGHVRRHFDYWLHDVLSLQRRAGDIVFVARQESLEADFAEICRRLGLTASYHLPTDDVKMHKGSKEQNTTLDEVARQNLRLWYASDYVLLDACQTLFPMKEDGCVLKNERKSQKSSWSRKLTTPFRLTVKECGRFMNRLQR